MRSEVTTAFNVKIIVLRDMALCSLVCYELEYQSSSLKMKAAVFSRTWALTYKTIHHYT
jgi:hypothetical protein